MNLKQSIMSNLNTTEIVLDLCAGTGDLLMNFQGTKYGVELNQKYESLLIKHGYNKVYIKDVRDIESIPVEYTTVTWFDGIEHLEEKEALKVLEYVESKANKIMIFTPHEFQDNKHNAENLKEPLQEHKSVFPKEFWLHRGYEIIYKEYNEVEKVNNILYIKR